MSIADWDPTTFQAASKSFDDGSGESVDGVEHGEQNGHDAVSELLKDLSRPAGPKRDLHRLAIVRKQQGISPRNMARRLNVDIATVLDQERETTDLPLSTLYAWQKILEIPVADLLVDTDAPLSTPVFERARMVKVMKTAAAILEKAPSKAIVRLITMLIEQLLEIMPELRDVSAWHTVGQRRTLDDYGRAVERQLPDDFLGRH